MIAYIEGRLLAQTGESAVVLPASGVGYEVYLTTREMTALPAMGQAVAYHVHHVVREDGQLLFGFHDARERALFGLLISIPKLGPKKALAILSRFNADELFAAVRADDVSALTSVSGIGKKSGMQIMLELRYKLENTDLFVVAGRSSGTGEGTGDAVPAPRVLPDVVDALTNLGYTLDEARTATRAVLEAEPDLDVAAAIRSALKRLANS